MRNGQRKTGGLSAPDGIASSQMRNRDPGDVQRPPSDINVSDGSALRDRLTDDGRLGPDVPIYKQDLGFFIESSLELNSSVTRDRNPGGAPHVPLGPN